MTISHIKRDLYDLDPSRGLFEQFPLLKFSPYSPSQVRIVVELGEKILASLDESIEEHSVSSEGLDTVYTQFWLWVLAAYEVSRTMCQYRACFSERLATEVCAFKRQLSELRIPFAKLELRGTSQTIFGELSIAGFDTKLKDMTYIIKGERHSVRQFVQRFYELFESMTVADVLRSFDGRNEGES